MKQASLIDTNPHLKDPKKRSIQLRRSAASSCAVEGIIIDPDSLSNYQPISRAKKATLK